MVPQSSKKIIAKFEATALLSVSLGLQRKLISAETEGASCTNGSRIVESKHYTRVVSVVVHGMGSPLSTVYKIDAACPYEIELV